MKGSRWWSLLILALPWTITAKVVDLTVETFYGFTKSEKLAFVKFHAPWCGHCKSTSPAFENAANQIKAMGIEATFAQLDGSVPQVEELIISEKVDGFPTFFLYKNGHRVAEYNGNRSESDFVDYVQRKSIPSAIRIASELELVPYLSALDRTDLFQQGILGVVLGLFPIDETLQGHAAKLFENVADRYDFAKFFVSTTEKLIADFGVQGPTVVVFSADNRDIYHMISLSEAISEDDIIDELLMLSMPLSMPMSSELLPILSALPVMHALAFYDANGDDENFLDAVVSVMPKFKGKIMMVEVSSDEYHILHHFGMENSADLPQLIMVDPSSGRKFSFTDSLRTFHDNQMADGEEYELVHSNRQLFARTANVHYPLWIRPIAKTDDSDRLFFNTTLIEEFFRVFLEDETAQSLASQDLSEIAKLNEVMSSSNIENLASLQFEERVMQEVNVDSFVYFHAPWCIHCKAMEALMVELADHYREDAGIHFFRIDAQKNDIAHRQVKMIGLPAMYLFPAEDKGNPHFFDGDRTLQKFVDFIDQNRQYKVLSLSSNDVDSHSAKHGIDINGL